MLLAACGSAPERSETTPGEEAPRVDLTATLESGKAAYAAKKWREAERHYEILVKRIPQEPDHWFRLGNIYGRTDRPDLAVAAYREVLIRDSDYAKAWFNMGILQLRQAANSFRKMEVHVDESEPMRKQATHAYEAILGIISGDGKPAEKTVEIPVAAPASIPPDTVESPAITTVEPVPASGFLDDAVQAGSVERAEAISQPVAIEHAESIGATAELDAPPLPDQAAQPALIEPSEVAGTRQDVETPESDVPAPQVDVAAESTTDEAVEISEAPEVVETPTPAEQAPDIEPIVKTEDVEAIESTAELKIADETEKHAIDADVAQIAAPEVLDSGELAEHEVPVEDPGSSRETEAAPVSADSAPTVAGSLDSEQTAGVADVEILDEVDGGSDPLTTEDLDSGELVERSSSSEDTGSVGEIGADPVTADSAAAATQALDSAQTAIVEDAGVMNEQASDPAQSAATTDVEPVEDIGDGMETVAEELVVPVEQTEPVMAGEVPPPPEATEEMAVAADQAASPADVEAQDAEPIEELEDSEVVLEANDVGDALNAGAVVPTEDNGSIAEREDTDLMIDVDNGSEVVEVDAFVAGQPREQAMTDEDPSTAAAKATAQASSDVSSGVLKENDTEPTADADNAQQPLDVGSAEKVVDDGPKVAVQDSHLTEQAGEVEKPAQDAKSFAADLIDDAQNANHVDGDE